VTLLRVTAHLSTPIAARQPVQLDAILIQAHPDVGGNQISRATPESEIIEPGIGVHRLRVFGEHVFLASEWIVPEKAQRGLEHIVKRKDSQDLDALASNWQGNLGPGKNRCVPMPLIQTDAVAWIVVGQGHGIRSLLHHIHHVGGVRGQGYGVVREWVVEPLRDVPVERVLITADGRAARHLPAVWVEPGPPLDAGAWLPPYWHPARIKDRIRAGTPCVLRPQVLEAVRQCR